MHRTPANRIKVNFAVNQKLLAKSQSPTTNRAATTKRHRQMFAHSYSYSPKKNRRHTTIIHTYTYILACTHFKQRFTSSFQIYRDWPVRIMSPKTQIKKKMSIIKFTFFHSRFQLAAQMKK